MKTATTLHLSPRVAQPPPRLPRPDLPPDGVRAFDVQNPAAL